MLSRPFVSFVVSNSRFLGSSRKREAFDPPKSELRGVWSLASTSFPNDGKRRIAAAGRERRRKERAGVRVSGEKRKSCVTDSTTLSFFSSLFLLSLLLPACFASGVVCGELPPFKSQTNTPAACGSTHCSSLWEWCDFQSFDGQKGTKPVKSEKVCRPRRESVQQLSFQVKTTSASLLSYPNRSITREAK